MSRLKAFGIHVGISFIIFLFLAYLVVFQWYPDFFFDTDGGWRGLRIIVAVDMVLGPALTLVVFKAGKPGLKTDLALIGLFQFVCLVAGTYVVWNERPIAVVYNDGRFTAMTSEDYDSLDNAPDFSSYPGDNPKWVMVEIPEGIEEENAFRKEMFKAGTLISSAVDRYIPFSTEHKQFLDQSFKTELILKKEGGQESLDLWVTKHGGSIEDYAFYPLSTRYTYVFIGYRVATGERLGLLPITAN